ncbi:MAG: hypothetical protein V4642_15325 [Bacteroidota bacterium]
MKYLIATIFILCCLGGCESGTGPTAPKLGPYASYTIKAITLTKIPLKDLSGGEWDVNGAPDIYFKFKDYLSNDIYNGDSLDQADISVPDGLPVVWVLSSPLTITEDYIPINLEFFDKDSFDDEKMGTVNFRRPDLEKDWTYPKSVKISDSTTQTEVTFSLTWNK